MALQVLNHCLLYIFQHFYKINSNKKIKNYLYATTISIKPITTWQSNYLFCASRGSATSIYKSRNLKIQSLRFCQVSHSNARGFAKCITPTINKCLISLQFLNIDKDYQNFKDKKYEPSIINPLSQMFTIVWLDHYILRKKKEKILELFFKTSGTLQRRLFRHRWSFIK